MFNCKTSPEIGGMGHSVKRKEDARFLHGKGNYVDDVKLPGMLSMVMVRSPYAYAKIKSINKEKALAIDGVLAVITGEDLAQYNLHWMPTLLSDQQMVLPTDTVMHQSQEVCAVIATDRYIAVDGAEAVEVDYEPMKAIVDPFKALDSDAPLLRPEKEGQKDNQIYHWERGDRAKTDEAIANADVVVKERIFLPRIHVASIETCGCVASYDKDTEKLTVYLTTQAPHAIRTVVALVAGHVGLSEEKIRIISPDIGGGFGGKVPVYPSYVVAIAATFLIGKPVKWIEDRSENLVNGFARDYHMDCELAATKEGKIQAFKVKTLADHGYTDSSANPSKYPTGMFSICTGSYDYEHAFAELDAVYTNKAPGGVAYRCSFRVTEAVHAIERMVDKLALKIGKAKGIISNNVFNKYLAELNLIPEKIEKSLSFNNKIEEIADQIKDSTNCLYLGRGFNFPVALEGALKLKEISYIHAEGYPAAEMKHGPIALIDENMPTVVIATAKGHYDKVVSNIREIQSRKGKIIAIITEGDKDVKEIADYYIEIPETIESLTPLLTTIPLQLLSYHTAVKLGKNVDQPRNLAKSVTVE